MWNEHDTYEERTKKIIEEWEKIDAKNIGNIFEMAIVGIFYKILKDTDLCAIRSAKYDDYEHGVDTIIFDKKIGKIICAFDEFIDYEKKNDKSYKKKLKRIKSKGGNLEYGIAYEKNKENELTLVKKEIANIPMFCLNLSQDELQKVLDEMEFATNKNSNELNPNEAELTFFNKMIELMEEQTQNLINEQGINEELRENLGAIPEALEKMRDASAQYKM